APGGKTAGLAGTGARVTAVEKNAQRAETLRQTLARLGAEAEGVEADARAFSAEPFDAVLVDAPCSGLGVLNGRADARWSRTAEAIGELAELQRGLLARARELTRPGGRLIYATCTLSPAENEQVPQALGLAPVSE